MFYFFPTFVGPISLTVNPNPAVQTKDFFLKRYTFPHKGFLPTRPKSNIAFKFRLLVFRYQVFFSQISTQRFKTATFSPSAVGRYTVSTHSLCRLPKLRSTKSPAIAKQVVILDHNQCYLPTFVGLPFSKGLPFSYNSKLQFIQFSFSCNIAAASPSHSLFKYICQHSELQ